MKKQPAAIEKFTSEEIDQIAQQIVDSGLLPTWYPAPPPKRQKFPTPEKTDPQI